MPTAARRSLLDGMRSRPRSFFQFLMPWSGDRSSGLRGDRALDLGDGRRTRGDDTAPKELAIEIAGTGQLGPCFVGSAGGLIDDREEEVSDRELRVLEQSAPRASVEVVASGG